MTADQLARIDAAVASIGAHVAAITLRLEATSLTHRAIDAARAGAHALARRLRAQAEDKAMQAAAIENAPGVRL